MLTRPGDEEESLPAPSWFKRPIGPGDTGPDVKVVLRKLGLDPEEPYGDLAVTRVKGLARSMAIYDHDGSVDSTIAALLGEAEIVKAGLIPAWYTIKLGDYGTHVASVAKLLGETVTEEYTVELADAVRRFQSSKRLEPTGVVDAETARALGEL